MSVKQSPMLGSFPLSCISAPIETAGNWGRITNRCYAGAGGRTRTSGLTTTLGAVTSLPPPRGLLSSHSGHQSWLYGRQCLCPRSHLISPASQTNKQKNLTKPLQLTYCLILPLWHRNNTQDFLIHHKRCANTHFSWQDLWCNYHSRNSSIFTK